MKFLVTASLCQVGNKWEYGNGAGPFWMAPKTHRAKNSTEQIHLYFAHGGESLFAPALCGRQLGYANTNTATNALESQLNNDTPSPYKMLPTAAAAQAKRQHGQLRQRQWQWQRQPQPLPHVDFANWNYIMQCMVNKPRHTWLHK